MFRVAASALDLMLPVLCATPAGGAESAVEPVYFTLVVLSVLFYGLLHFRRQAGIAAAAAAREAALASQALPRARDAAGAHDRLLLLLADRHAAHVGEPRAARAAEVARSDGAHEGA